MGTWCGTGRGCPKRDSSRCSIGCCCRLSPLRVDQQVVGDDRSRREHTRIQYGGIPPVLCVGPGPFCSHILVDRTGAGKIGLVFRIDLRVIDAVLVLQPLKPVLHLLLSPFSTRVAKSNAREVGAYLIDGAKFPSFYHLVCVRASMTCASGMPGVH
jgi:hypothetical protein